MSSVWCPKKKIIELCSASNMTFWAWFYRTDPQNIEGQFGKLRAFWETLFENERAKKKKKKPEIYFGPKSFRTILDKNLNLALWSGSC